jgi:uncharacterized protein YodC (DUF2158 family)
MADNTIEVGHAVRRKHDGPMGPLMTIDSIDGDSALCSWSDALDSVHTQIFHLDELERSELDGTIPPGLPGLR